MVVLPELMRDAAPTFLYEGNGPVLILVLLLAGFLYYAQRRLPTALIESGAIVAAFFLPPLLLDEPVLYVIGILMALVAVIVIPRVSRRTNNSVRWVVGALLVYMIVMLVIGQGLGPDLKDEVSAFHIMDWRDGLMGVAMITMMVLRPAGIIPERRRGVITSAVAPAPESVPTAAVQQTI
jgi:hypothetical protein